jgi:hypothetical protein
VLGKLGGKLSAAADTVCRVTGHVAEYVHILHERQDPAPYLELMKSVTPIGIGDAPHKGRGWILASDGTWFPCMLARCNDDEDLWGHLRVYDIAEGIEEGMIGSPIVDDDGLAVGMLSAVATSFDDDEDEPILRVASPNLAHCLPAWFLIKV